MEFAVVSDRGVGRRRHVLMNNNHPRLFLGIVDIHGHLSRLNHDGLGATTVAVEGFVVGAVVSVGAAVQWQLARFILLVLRIAHRLSHGFHEGLVYVASSVSLVFGCRVECDVAGRPGRQLLRAVLDVAHTLTTEN